MQVTLKVENNVRNRYSISASLIWDPVSLFWWKYLVQDIWLFITMFHMYVLWDSDLLTLVPSLSNLWNHLSTHLRRLNLLPCCTFPSYLVQSIFRSSANTLVLLSADSLLIPVGNMRLGPELWRLNYTMTLNKFCTSCVYKVFT